MERMLQPSNLFIQDPREYLPFLRELRALSEYYQRFRIDDHLRRYEMALQNLSMAGEGSEGDSSCTGLNSTTGSQHFEEAMTYVERHKLYGVALSIWKNTPQYQVCLSFHSFTLSQLFR
jgi:elongator complex protein 1